MLWTQEFLWPCCKFSFIPTREVNTLPPTTEAMSPEWCLAFFKLGAAQHDGKTLIKAVQVSHLLRLKSLAD